MKQIDSHHHLWKYNETDYVWMNESMKVLKQDYLPPDLKANLDQSHIDGTVVVQARQMLKETEWLLELASQYDYIYGVVGWVPLINENVRESLEKYSSNKYLKAVRHVLHDEPDDAYMLREDFNRGISQLRDFNLVYDVLIFAKHLKNTIKFVDKHKNQPFVVDHIAKPVIQSEQYDQNWDDEIRELARRENVYCKLSGVITEVRDENWDMELIQPYFDTVIEAFEPKRIMFGTDWPVCRLRLEYPEWASAVRKLISTLSEDEQNQIMSSTASTVYELF